MARTNFDQLLQAGCHFGHLHRKWNPAMKPYIYMERNGIHIIDLHKTVVKKMTNIDKLMNDGTFSNLSKREILQISRQRAKLEKNLGSISELTRLPAALFVIDVMKEHIAVKEANRLGIPVFAIVDTNSNPTNIDYVIPANDDAKDSINAVLTACCEAITEGLEERKVEKADEKAAAEQAEEAAEAKPRRAARKKAVKEEKAAEN